MNRSDRPRYKVATAEGVHVGDTPTAPLRAAQGGPPAPAPGFPGAPGVFVWLAGRWWQWDAGSSSWSPVARVSPPAVTWSEPAALSPELASWVRGMLEASGRETLAVPLGGSYVLLAAERGAPALRHASAAPSRPSDLAPPPAPESREPFRDVSTSMRQAAEQIARDFRRRRVVEDARAVVNRTPGALEPRGRPNARRIVWALFEDQKRRAPFHSDPLDTELIGSTEAILCLDPDGACLGGGDCDDQIVALCARALAEGVPVRLRARKYKGRRQPHVFVEYQAPSRDPARARKGEAVWEAIDPSVEDGHVSPKPWEQEWMQSIDTSPQYIGLGDPPETGTLGADTLPAAGDATSSASSSSSSTTPSVQTTAMDPAQAAAWMTLYQAVANDFAASLAELQTVAQQYPLLRQALSLPTNDAATSTGTGTTPGQTETVGTQGTTTTTGTTSSTPLTDYITSVNQGAPAWTADAQTAEQTLLANAAIISQALEDGVTGARQLYFDSQGQLQGFADLLVQALPADTLRMQIVVGSDGTQQVEYIDASSGSVTGTLGAVWEVVAIAGAVAIVSIAAAYATSRYMDTLRAAHDADMLKKVSDNATQLQASGVLTPAQAQAQIDALTHAATALAAQPPATSSDLASVAKAIGVGAVAIASIYGLSVLAHLVPRARAA